MLSCGPEHEALAQAVGAELLNGPENLLGRSSRGGTVHLGRWKSRDVAIKLHAGLSNITHSAPSPSHPNLANVLARQADESGNVLEVRELCGGGELYDRIAEEGSFQLEEALNYFAQAASGIAHCHAHGVVHGQLRPEHVLLGNSGQVQVVGFNTARVSDGKSVSPLVPLRPLRALDAPELHTAASVISAEDLKAADIWSLGTLLLAMLMGSPPFASSVEGTKEGLSAQVCEQLGVLPERMRTTLVAMLQPAPSARPSAAEVASVFVNTQHGAHYGTPVGSDPRDYPHAAHMARPPAPTGGAPARSEGTFAGGVETSALPGAGNPSSCRQGVASTSSKSAASSSGSLNGASAVPVAATLSGSDEGPPVRPLKEEGYVRSLGWESLPHSASTLVESITSSLRDLNVPFEFRPAKYIFIAQPPEQPEPSTPQSAPELLGSEGSDVLNTPCLDASTMRLGPSEGSWESVVSLQPLVIFIHVLRENAASPRHDVSVRRLQGTSWRFQTFYSAFREQMTANLGLADYTQLSLYSPIAHKRQLSPSQLRASSWFFSRGPDGAAAGSSRSSGGFGVAANASPSRDPSTWPVPHLSVADEASSSRPACARFKRTSSSSSSLSLPAPTGGANGWQRK